LLRSKYTKVDSKGNLKNTEILQGGREGGREEQLKVGVQESYD
jgi:hypothetical protein